MSSLCSSSALDLGCGYISSSTQLTNVLDRVRSTDVHELNFEEFESLMIRVAEHTNTSVATSRRLLTFAILLNFAIFPT